MYYVVMKNEFKNQTVSYVTPQIMYILMGKNEDENNNNNNNDDDDGDNNIN